MSTRAILIAATAVAAGMAATSASALVPLTADASFSSPPEAPVARHATLAPHDFERRPDAEYEPNAVISDPRARSQCVPFAREESGVEIYGNANTWWEQAKHRYETDAAPHEGAVVALHGYGGANRGHVAVVKEIVSERMIIVDHANWLNTGEITRDVPVRDVSPNNDWSQVQVWNVTGEHWGGRTYNVQGFILNIADDAKKTAAAPVA